MASHDAGTLASGGAVRLSTDKTNGDEGISSVAGKTVLFVCMTESVHTARWMRQIAELGMDCHVFPSAGLGLNQDLSDVTVHYLLAAAQSERGLSGYFASIRRVERAVLSQQR